MNTAVVLELLKITHSYTSSMSRRVLQRAANFHATFPPKLMQGFVIMMKCCKQSQDLIYLSSYHLLQRLLPLCRARADPRRPAAAALWTSNREHRYIKSINLKPSCMNFPSTHGVSLNEFNMHASSMRKHATCIRSRSRRRSSRRRRRRSPRRCRRRRIPPHVRPRRSVSCTCAPARRSCET